MQESIVESVAVEVMEVEPATVTTPVACPKKRKRKSTTRRVTPKKKTPKRTHGKRIVKKTTTTRVTKTTKTVKRTVIRKMKLTKELKIRIKPYRFRAWKEDQFVIDTLVARGWVYAGEPVVDGREDYPHSMYEAKDQGKIDMGSCLFWADDDDSKVLQGMSSNHLISSIPFADKALTKVFQQRMFNEFDWFPKCFTLPKEKPLLLECIKQNPESYWICKPRDGYGGFGMCVFKANSEDFNTMLDRKSQFVVQRYMHNPYLFANTYKFHVRAYMVVTHAEPVRAHLWKNAQIQFATHKFDLTQIEKNFNKYSHITNWKVNNEKKNKKFAVLDKPGIGQGTEWTIKKFITEMTKNEPKFSETRFWDELEKIAKVVANKLMSSKYVKKGFGGKAMVHNHFEVYGLDILMDENCNLRLTEANTQPGLDFSDPQLTKTVYVEEVSKANDVTRGIINDTITLLGLDNHKKFFSPFIRL